MIGASAALWVEEFGFAYPFEATAPLLREGDLTVANLEGPLTARGRPEVEKRFTFRVPPASAAVMRRAGIDAVALGNNHVLDQGRVGLEDTLAALREAGIAASGAGMTEREARTPARVVRRGVRIALLSYSNTFPEEFWAKGPSPGTAYGAMDAVEADVRAARRDADMVIVSFHWGAELAPDPKEYQTKLGRLAVDAGADLVLGTHPHTLQGIEWYRGALVFYSLGNFAFGSYSARVKDGLLARMTFRGRIARPDGLVEPVWDPVTLVPLDVFNPEVHFQPQPVGGERARQILADLARMSAALGTRIEAAPPPEGLPAAPGPVGVVR
jgi:poly-gamma-glutamate capsule biosynthesis protein CapA/YwtB (metallophosphatase superfamily)